MSRKDRFANPEHIEEADLHLYTQEYARIAVVKFLRLYEGRRCRL